MPTTETSTLPVSHDTPAATQPALIVIDQPDVARFALINAFDVACESRQEAATLRGILSLLQEFAECDAQTQDELLAQVLATVRFGRQIAERLDIQAGVAQENLRTFDSLLSTSLLEESAVAADAEEGC